VAKYTNNIAIALFQIHPQMKYFILIVITSLLLNAVQAQKITYSELNKKETSNMYFEILGRFGKASLIYKNISREHFLSKYDQDMKLIEQVQLTFIPEKAFNLDFINYNDHLVGVYQYQKNNIVFCYAFRLDSTLTQAKEPIVVDTARIGFYADNKIYNLTYSDNKKQLLIYKRTLKGDAFTQVTKTFNPEIVITDSSKHQQIVNNRRDLVGEPLIDNDGNILFCHTHERSQKFQSDSMSLYFRRPGEQNFLPIAVNLDNHFIEEPVVKVDQLNKKYIINAYASSDANSDPEGLFTTVIDFDLRPKGSTFNTFSQDIKQSLNTYGYNNTETPALSSRNIILKKNNGFTLIAECSYTESIRNSNFSSGSMFGGYPYGFANDYYYYNPYSYRYRPWGSNSAYQQTRFHADNIIMMNLDSNLNVVGKTVINKKQSDVETDNYLSF